MKINYQDFVNENRINKYKEHYQITEYLGKIEKQHRFKIVFLGTKHEQMATYDQIKKETVRDLVLRKQLKRLKTQKELQERNRLTKQKNHKFSITEQEKNQRILSIDLATKKVGVAFGAYGKILKSCYFEEISENIFERSAAIVNKIVGMIKKAKITLVILEDIYLGLNATILEKLAVIRGMLIYECVNLGVSFKFFPAIHWKGFYKDMPRDREDQKAYSLRKAPEIIYKEYESDDEADALLMLNAALEYKERVV